MVDISTHPLASFRYCPKCGTPFALHYLSY